MSGRIINHSFSFTAKIWKWPGDMGWHFVHVPREYFEPIRKKYGKGMIKITATVGKTTPHSTRRFDGAQWDTSLFPHLQSKGYLLSIKAKVRKVEELWEGDEVKIRVVIRA